MTHHIERIVTADTEQAALQLLRAEMSALRKKRGIKDWEWRIPPETMKYDGRSKKLAGKWRAYGRIAYATH